MYWQYIFICVLLPTLIQGQECKDEVDNCAELLDQCDSLKDLCAESCKFCLKDGNTWDDAMAKYIPNPAARSAFMKEFGHEIEDAAGNAAQLVLTLNEKEKGDGVLPNPRVNPIKILQALGITSTLANSAKEFVDGFNNPEKDCGWDPRCHAGKAARKAYNHWKG